MNTAMFGENTIYFKDGFLYKLLRKINSNWQTEDVKTRELSNISNDELMKGYLDEDIKFPHPDTTHPDKPAVISHSITFEELGLDEKYSLQIRKWFIDEHIKHNGLSFSLKSFEDSLNKFWNEAEFGPKPFPTTVLDWARKYFNSNKNIMSLKPAHQNKGNRSRRVDELVVESVHLSIKEVLMNTARAPIKLGYERALVLISEKNKLFPPQKQLKIPSLKYYTKCFKSLPAYDVYAARYGQQAARKKFRCSIHSIEAQYPLHIVQIDSTPIDLTFVADNGVVLGKAWLTAVIDVKTRGLLGFHISFDPPSQSTLAKAFLNAILPKVGISERYGVIGQYPMHGLPDLVFVDNAREYHGEHFDSLCKELGISVSYMPSRTPWYKGHIESFLKTCNFDLTSRAKGKNFNSIEAKADNNPAKEATILFRKFESALMIWIVDYYHQKTHAEMGMSPNDAWKRETQNMTLRVPADIQRAKFLSLEMASRKVWIYGLDINSIRYNSVELHEQLRIHGEGQTFQLRWDKYDLGYVYVVTPDMKYIKVPANDVFQDYAPGMTLFQHNIHKRFLAQNNKEVNAINLAYTKDHIFKAMHEKGEKRSKKEQLYYESHPNANNQQPPAKPSKPPKLPPVGTDVGLEIPDFEAGVFQY
jgi:putative transposase